MLAYQWCVYQPISLRHTEFEAPSVAFRFQHPWPDSANFRRKLWDTAWPLQLVSAMALPLASPPIRS